MQPAQQVMRRLNALARISEEPGRLTRTFCSDAMKRANALVASWMRAAGMTVREDPIGNLSGTYSGTASGRKRRLFLMGSHLDTVRNAGKYDGPLGVALAVAAVEALKRERVPLPFDIGIIGFADEEGVRYQSAYLGSRAVAGTFNRKDLARKDPDGVSMADAIRRYGGDPGKLTNCRLNTAKILGYLEAHIEQGPVLEARNLPVGVVSAIAGQTRLSFVFTGDAAHAGTTPMRARRDAGCAAAAFILAVEKYARSRPGLVATVGQLKLEPNASNVVPGAATLTLDVRHQHDAMRAAAVAQLQTAARRIAARRQVAVAIQIVQQTNSVPCDGDLGRLLEQSVRRAQKRMLVLPSGAGHDAAVISAIAPVTMLFVRCKGGVSHNPAESVKAADVSVALRVMLDFLKSLAARYDLD
jgi:allantoate deiminase